MSLASALGHESLGSQAAYVRDSQRRLRSAESSRMHADRAQLIEEIISLRGQLALHRRRTGPES